MANDTIENFLEHAKPATVVESFRDLAAALTGRMNHRTQRRIASGEVTYRVVYEEGIYEGNYTAPDLAEWLSKYDSSWTVDMGDYGDTICVIKETHIPYTEEEIAAAKKFIEDHPEPDPEYIRFRVNHD